MTELNIITNITGFEHALEDVKARAPEQITEVRLAVSRKVKASELGARQNGGILVVGCNDTDRYMVGVACMSVFGHVPTEHLSSARQREEKLLGFVERQTKAIEGIEKLIQARPW